MFRDKRGMIGMAAVILVMVLTSVISMVALNFAYQASSLSIRQEKNFGDYQQAALGAGRGIWLLKQSTWMAQTTFPYNETVPGSSAGSVVTINIKYSAPNYTITSTAGGKTLVAVINNGAITSWD